jgi:tRNA C32,U32 (ribose-2'-O)-methylase TrmJ|tara:strand:- start:1240 stop:1467 length:228 start_codon:yes stop_codon:yes gene_type:complete
MKNYQDIKKNLAKLNEIDQQKARNIIKDLEKYTQKAEINQEGLKKLHDIQTQIVVFSQQYSDRLLQLLRQNHMID